MHENGCTAMVNTMLVKKYILRIGKGKGELGSSTNGFEFLASLV